MLSRFWSRVLALVILSTLAVVSTIVIAAVAFAHGKKPYCGDGKHRVNWYTTEKYTGDSSISGNKVYDLYKFGLWQDDVTHYCPGR